MKLAKKKLALITEQYGNLDKTDEKKPKTSKYSHFLEEETETVDPIPEPDPAPSPSPSKEPTPEPEPQPAAKPKAKAKPKAAPAAKAKPVEKRPAVRINMGFTDDNYAFLQRESERLDIPFAHLINTLIKIVEIDDMDHYMKTQALRLGGGLTRRGAAPLQRINIRFSPENDDKLTAEAQKHNTTKSQYLNMLIELYAKQQQ